MLISAKPSLFISDFVLLLIKLSIILLLISTQLQFFLPVIRMLFDTSSFLWCLAVCICAHLCLSLQMFSQVPPLLQSYMTPKHSASSCHHISKTNWEDFAVVQPGLPVPIIKMVWWVSIVNYSHNHRQFTKGDESFFFVHLLMMVYKNAL